VPEIPKRIKRLEPLYEISDELAKLKNPLIGEKSQEEILDLLIDMTKDLPTKPPKLGDVFSHPELFREYGELADVPVKFSKPASSWLWRGSYNPHHKEISIRAGTPSDALDCLIHEIQHAIAGIDPSVPRGTSVSRAGNIIEYKRQLGEILARNAAFRRSYTEAMRKGVPPLWSTWETLNRIRVPRNKKGLFGIMEMLRR